MKFDIWEFVENLLRIDQE